MSFDDFAIRRKFPAGVLSHATPLPPLLTVDSSSHRVQVGTYHDLIAAGIATNTAMDVPIYGSFTTADEPPPEITHDTSRATEDPSRGQRSKARPTPMDALISGQGWGSHDSPLVDPSPARLLCRTT